MELIYSRLILCVNRIIFCSRSQNPAFDINCMSWKCSSDLSVPISLSQTQTKSQFPASFFISLYLPLLFVTSSLFLAPSLVIVQQSGSLCSLSKRKPLHFLLCSQFILIDCSLTFHYAQWITKRSAQLRSYVGVIKRPLYILSYDSTVMPINDIFITRLLFSLIPYSPLFNTRRAPLLNHENHWQWCR